VPVRFEVDNLVEGNWLHAGRTKFKELLQELKEVRKSTVYTTVWLYGTQGYGKSHLLAALVCYLAAADERVVYIPDCRALLKSAVEPI
jgi:chromosomal replication initiation ATPase DnaA